jgi:hypothetical protein
MLKNEALLLILQQIDDIEETKLRLLHNNADLIDIEIGMLTDQVLSLYRSLQRFHKVFDKPVSEFIEDMKKKQLGGRLYSDELYASQLNPTNITSSNEEKNSIQDVVNEDLKNNTQKLEDKTVADTVISKESVKISVENNSSNEESPSEKLARLYAEARNLYNQNKKGAEPTNNPIHQPIPLNDNVESTVLENNQARENTQLETERIEEIVEQPTKIIEEKVETHQPQESKSVYDKLTEQQTATTSLNDKLASLPQNPIMADKLKNMPISDLKGAININQKFAFINHLFKGDDGAFKKHINFLNECKSYAEAKYYFNNELAVKYAWREEDPIATELSELIYRRFINN